MKDIFKKIWMLAKQYYKRGRPMDIMHIEWMMKAAEIICKKEKLDDSLLIPLVILHDVGYAETGPAYLEKNLKQAHMDAGKVIAQKILREVKYPEEKSKLIEYYISVHDNWIFNDYEVYKKNKILAIFTDLDFIWMATKKGFHIIRKILKKKPKEMLNYLKKENHSFAIKATKEIYEKYLSDRNEECLYKN